MRVVKELWLETDENPERVTDPAHREGQAPRSAFQPPEEEDDRNVPREGEEQATDLHHRGTVYLVSRSM